MVKVPDSFIHQVLYNLFEGGGEKNSDIGAFFRYWKEQDEEEVASTAENAGVDIDSLIEGDPHEAMKFLTENPSPLAYVIDFLADPMTQLRLKEKNILSPDIIDRFKDSGYESLIRDVVSIDLHHSTHNLVTAVHTVLELYGFVLIDDSLEAVMETYPGGPAVNRETFGNLEMLESAIDAGLRLPFNDFTLIYTYGRGVDNVNLSIHHRSPGAIRQGKYHARTLIGNTKLLEALKTIPYEEVRRRFFAPGRDPLGMAFDKGFTIDIGNGRFAYHPRVLVEALTDKIDNPSHRYFFDRALGRSFGQIPPPDMQNQLLQQHMELLKAHIGQLVPSDDKEEPDAVHQIPVNFKRGSIRVDVGPFMPILRHECSKRIKGIKSLANLYHLKLHYALQSRLEHCVGVMHVARVMCEDFKIDGYDKLKTMTYALVHDWGHLTGSHPTELYFKAKEGFDHEEFAISLIEKNREVFSDMVDPDDIVAMFRQEDPLHSIVDGPFGSDRIYYLTVDPNMCGVDFDYEPMRLISHLRWVNGQVVVDQMPEWAFEFLNNRAQLYEDIYFAPHTQIADAYQRKMLHAAGIQNHDQKIFLQDKGSLDIVPKGGVELEFWQLNDMLMQYYFSNHQDLAVREPMRHLMSVYHKSPHATVAVLKIDGFEGSEKPAMVPVYQLLKIGEIQPRAEGVDPKELGAYQKSMFLPENAAALEQEIARRIGIPERHVIVAAVPNLSKLASENAPVRMGGEVRSLFDWDTKYSAPFVERANRMTCLRVAVHPQIYPYAHQYFEDHSLTDIVREVLGK